LTESERAEFDALRDRVEMLEMALGLNYTAPTGYGLTATESRLLGILLATKIASRDRIMTALYAGTDDPPFHHVIPVFVKKIRQKTQRHGIEIKTIFNVGYMLTPESRAILAAA
jgi:DNA-binding response OmpR family regulator